MRGLLIAVASLSFFIENLTFKRVLFICLFLAALGLLCCTGFPLVAVSRSYSLAAVCGLLIEVVFLAVEHWLSGVWT